MISQKSKVVKEKKGFTLVELLIVISIIGVLSAVGIVSFSSYSRKQTLDQASYNFRSAIEKARSNAVSRVVPNISPSCALPLSYSINVSCSNPVSYTMTTCSNPPDIGTIISNYSLPKGVNLRGYNCSSLSFYSSSNFLGCSSGDIPAKFAIADANNNIRLITVDNGGNITISSLQNSNLQNFNPWTVCP